MKSLVTALTLALGFFGASTASPVAELAERRSGKATGGPASATITVYSGPYTCTSASTAPPTDGSAGTVVKTFTISETQCQVVNVPFQGAVTATLTATPKSGTAGCWVQVFQQQGCTANVGNAYVGFPFSGLTVGSTVGCYQVPDMSYYAVEIVCA